MVSTPGGAFRMGSDRHYAEEAPVHRVTVDGVWIDRTPGTNRQFHNFMNVMGYVTYAEIAPYPKDYPGALPHMLKARAANYCRRYRPVARHLEPKDISTSHVGFRCIIRQAGAAP
jgi:formylglycine-generating enzyme required for sulfatase activity